VTTNTTLFEGADPARTLRFFDRMMELGVEGMTISPGYPYERAPDPGRFLARKRTQELFRELLDGTRWQDYGPASGNPRCTDCMVHSGFEASAVEEAFSSLRGMLPMIRAALFGPRTGPG
jgi:hypothetical protein